MKRKATAVWHGTLKEGNGHLSTQSGALKQVPYNYKMRFENEKGTNPEELIGAAHSGCFSMQLSAFLAEEGHKPVELETQAEVTLDNGTITSSHLRLKAKVPGIDREKFDSLAQKAKENCPVSKLLKADVSLDITLNE